MAASRRSSLSSPFMAASSPYMTYSMPPPVNQYAVVMPKYYSGYYWTLIVQWFQFMGSVNNRKQRKHEKIVVTRVQKMMMTQTIFWKGKTFFFERLVFVSLEASSSFCNQVSLFCKNCCQNERILSHVECRCR
jgi:hypothetical protein